MHTDITPQRHTVSQMWLIACALIAASVLMMAGAMWHSPVISDSEASTGTLATAGWPPLAVTYRMDDTIARLDYQDARHWRKEVLESRGHPASVGTVMSFEDSTVRHYPVNTIDARTGQAAVEQDTLTDGIAVPERWLHPGFAAVLKYKHYVVSDGDTPQTLVYRQVFPAVKCAVQEPGRPPTPQPAPCAHSDTYREVETWTFRTDITPPMAIAGRSEAEGQVQWQVEVLSVERAP